MILIDTSAWVEVLRGRAGQRYADAVRDEVVVTCLPVIQEVLQGIDHESAFHAAAAAFADITILENPLTRSVIDDAVQLYRDEDAKPSQSVRAWTASSPPVLSATAQLSFDRDYTHLARISRLKVKQL